MATFYLIRHGAHDLLGRAMAGRMPGVHLNAAGQRQAERLAERLGEAPLRAIYSSPLERARETAAPLAARLGLPVQLSEALGEIDFGEWTGRTFDELRDIPRWHQFNAYRSGTRIPNGELMLEAQARIVGEMERLREQYPHDHLALVGHADVLKAAVAYYLGVPLDLFPRIEISPGSVSVAALSDYGPQIVRLNDTGDLQ
jgi:probable phosphomutase (TIGR03848 family)